MRDINRIEPFMEELTTIWKEQCPDWRFGQFISNVLGWIQSEKEIDIFFIEEDKILEYIKEYFDL